MTKLKKEIETKNRIGELSTEKSTLYKELSEMTLREKREKHDKLSNKERRKEIYSRNRVIELELAELWYSLRMTQLEIRKYWKYG